MGSIFTFYNNDIQFYFHNIFSIELASGTQSLITARLWNLYDSEMVFRSNRLFYQFTRQCYFVSVYCNEMIIITLLFATNDKYCY